MATKKAKGTAAAPSPAAERSFTVLLLTRGGYVALHATGCPDVARALRRGDAQNGDDWRVSAPAAGEAVAKLLAGFAEQEMEVSASDIKVLPCCGRM